MNAQCKTISFCLNSHLTYYLYYRWGLFWFYVPHIEGFSIYIPLADDFKVNKTKKKYFMIGRSWYWINFFSLCYASLILLSNIVPWYSLIGVINVLVGLWFFELTDWKITRSWATITWCRGIKYLDRLFFFFFFGGLQGIRKNSSKINKKWGC